MDKIYDSGCKMPKQDLLDYMNDSAIKSPSGTLASLMTDRGNSYGKYLFVDSDNFVSILPELEAEFKTIWCI